MKVGIVITCKNLLEYTRQAIESIKTSHPFVLIVVDDFSTDGTKKYMKALKEKYSNVIHVEDPLTYSLSEKWNIGCQLSWLEGCDAALVCNNDIVFHPCTIDALVARIEKGDVGMVSAHNIRGELEDNAEDLFDKVPPEHPTEAPHPDFSCFMLTKDTWDKVGEFDPMFIPCYFEDGDYHLRMGKAGIKAISTTSAIYLHYGSRTQNSIPGGMCPGPQFDKLREYLRSKHGTVPGDPDYDRICQLPFNFDPQQYPYMYEA